MFIGKLICLVLISKLFSILGQKWNPKSGLHVKKLTRKQKAEKLVNFYNAIFFLIRYRMQDHEIFDDKKPHSCCP